VASPDVGDGCPDVEQLPEVSGEGLVCIDVDLGLVVAEEDVLGPML
jgi:hypothetical protein